MYLIMGDSQSDTINANTRLSQFCNMFQLFRFRHLHIRYVPLLVSTNANHGVIQLGYASDSSIMDGQTLTGANGWSGATGVISLLQPSMSAPSWLPFDFELNFAEDQWYYCDPEGSNVGDTADAEAVGLRSVMQGMLLGSWLDNWSGTVSIGLTMGAFYVDYAVEFSGPVLQSPDISVALSPTEKKALNHMLVDGWRPSEPTPPISATPQKTGVVRK